MQADMAINYIDDKVKSLIGVEGPVVQAYRPVEASEIRRFFQAVMDPAPRYWSEEWAKNNRYGGIVAPPAFAVHAFRRAPDMPDFLDGMRNPDFDGRDPSYRNLPPLPIPLGRLLNGGYEYSFYRYVRVGQRIFRKSRYKDIYQRMGKSGVMVFVVIEDRYFTESESPLIDVVAMNILR
jgi:hypothetical protein